VPIRDLSYSQEQLLEYLCVICSDSTNSLAGTSGVGTMEIVKRVLLIIKLSSPRSIT